MRGLVATRLAFLLWLLPLGCGPGVGEGFPGDGGVAEGDSDTDVDSDSDTDSDTDTDTGPPEYHECPVEMQSECQSEQPGIETLLEAVELGPDITFAGMGRNALIAARTVDETTSPLMVRMDFDEYDGVESLGLAELAEPPTSSLTPVAVVGDLDSDIFGYWALVLVEGDDGYSFMGTDVYYMETGELVPLPAVAPPATTELRGLIYLQQKVPDAAPDYEKVCAFGDGLFCFDGSGWTTLIEPAAGTSINDIGMIYFDGVYQLLAVGDDGWIAHRDGETWSAIDSGTAQDLLTVSVDDTVFTAAGREGTVVYGTAAETVACEIAEQTILVLSGIPDEGILGIFDTGPVFFWQLGEWGPTACLTGADVPDALETRIVGCDASLNLFVLTEAALYGGNECVVVE
jgi:hypothetical protein